MARKRLGEILVQAGVIDEVQLKAALGEQRKWGRPLGQTLVEMRFIDESTLVRLLSTQLNIPAVVLDNVVPTQAALRKLDYEFCATHMCFPFAFEDIQDLFYITMGVQWPYRRAGRAIHHRHRDFLGADRFRGHQPLQFAPW